MATTKKINCEDCEFFCFGGKGGNRCRKRQRYVEKRHPKKVFGCDVVEFHPAKDSCKFYRKEPEILYWSYRVVRRTTDDKGNPVKEPYHAMHEVYFVEDPVSGEPVPHLWDPKPETLEGGTVEDLIWTLNAMLKDIKKPVYNEEDMPGNRKKKKRV